MSAFEGARRVGLGAGAEFDRIRAILAKAAPPGPGVRVGPGDDALVLEGGTVLSSDLSVEDVHFRRAWLSLEEIGYRATVAALSDLAAMTARVVGALASIAVAPADATDGLEAVADGVRGALEAAGGALLGGDLTSSPGPLVVDVIAVGRAEEPTLRSGSMVGDLLWVTGRLGAAAGAVRLWKGGTEPGPGLRDAYARPTARIAEAEWLRQRGVMHGLIDVSDGIGGDAGHLAAAGGVAVVLDAGAVPLHSALSPDVMDDLEALECGIRGGEDYELLFTAAPGSVEAVQEAFTDRFGVELTAVGRVEEGRGVRIEGAGVDGAEIVGGFDHFAEGGPG